jgi:hypothetical protein
MEGKSNLEPDRYREHVENASNPNVWVSKEDETYKFSMRQGFV